MLRYIIWLSAVIGLIIILLLLIIPGGKTLPPPKTLASYAPTSAVAKLTIDGPINADSQHQSIDISVSSSQVVYRQVNGYDSDVVKQETFTNTQSAYYNFLRAIALAGYKEGNTEVSASNPTGYCSSGDRYIYKLTENGSNIINFWSTSCGGPKTYDGDVDITLSLFEAQVPGYYNLTSGVRI